MWDDVIEEDVPVSEPTPEEPAPAEPHGHETLVEGEPAATEETVKGFEPKTLVFKHWVRPKFLQYNYLYDYQQNYYDDVINYLDRRNKGLPVEKPRAQTWAERALRTYLSKGSRTISTRTRETQLLHHISTGARFYRYHSKSIISRKYSQLGFNTVNV